MDCFIIFYFPLKQSCYFLCFIKSKIYKKDIIYLHSQQSDKQCDNFILIFVPSTSHLLIVNVHFYLSVFTNLYHLYMLSSNFSFFHYKCLSTKEHAIFFYVIIMFTNEYNFFEMSSCCIVQLGFKFPILPASSQPSKCWQYRHDLLTWLNTNFSWTFLSQ
jgi:hypothetical protein